jgi:hypothetical protein
MHASAGDRTATPSRHAGPRVLSETPRCMARCAWQSDADADKCSISRCNNTFSWMPGARRHHCRQCGRVVCQDCSRGQVAKNTFRPRQSALQKNECFCVDAQSLCHLIVGGRNAWFCRGYCFLRSGKRGRPRRCACAMPAYETPR